MRIDKLVADYKLLMKDVRTRNDAINAVISDPGQLPVRLVQEFCFLQLRMMAELVALGCVVLHDRLPPAEVKKLRRSYHPDKILAIIETYEPRFFPQAIVSIVEVGPGHKEIQPADPPVMEARDLRRMWGRTGDVLHWGTVDKMREQTAADAKHTEVRLMQRKFLDLLETHVILTAGETRPFICEINNARTGKVEMVWAERLPNQ